MAEGSDGMQTYESHMKQLVESGDISRETASAMSGNSPRRKGDR